MMTSDFVPCMVSQMDFFKRKPVQTCITGRMIQKLKPLSALPEVPDVIEFTCPGRALHYMDINNMALRLTVSMRLANGAVMAEADKDVSVIDAPLHTLFSQCEVFLSETPVTKSPHLYHYKALLDLHTLADSNARKGMLTSSLYIPDWTGANAEATSPWSMRQAPFLKSEKVELMGKLRPDICYLDDGAYILDNVPIRVRLTLNPPEVYLWADKEDKWGKLLIHDAELNIPYLVGSPDLSLGIEQMLSQQPATYRFKGSQIKTFLHQAGSVNLSIPVAFSGKLPTSILLVPVMASNFNGSKMKNPFHFPHCGFQEISFICNGTERRFVMDAAKPFRCTSLLRSLYTEMGMDCEEASGNAYSMTSIQECRFACAVDLTIDGTGSGPSQNLQEFGTVSIQGRLSAALGEAACIILYAKYDSVLEINASREVVVL